MPLAIELFCEIDAHIDLVFDLLRSAKLRNIESLEPLLEKKQRYTWMWHGKATKLEMRTLESPYYMLEERLEGYFKVYNHEYRCKYQNGRTILIYFVQFEASGLFAFLTRGKLKKQLQKDLSVYMNTIKQIAETEDWMEYLPSPQQYLAKTFYGG